MRSPPALLCVCVCAPVKDHALAACVTRKGHAQLAEVCSVTELHALRAAREQAVRTANAVTAREHNLGALSTQPLFLRDRDQAHATAKVDARQGQTVCQCAKGHDSLGDQIDVGPVRKRRWA